MPPYREAERARSAVACGCGRCGGEGQCRRGMEPALKKREELERSNWVAYSKRYGV